MGFNVLISFHLFSSSPLAHHLPLRTSKDTTSTLAGRDQIKDCKTTVEGPKQQARKCRMMTVTDYKSEQENQAQQSSQTMMFERRNRDKRMTTKTDSLPERMNLFINFALLLPPLNSINLNLLVTLFNDILQSYA